MDGWGIAPPGPGNAIAAARTPVFDELWSSNPHAALAASGPAVGLPQGQMGNSEVGHLTLGAGAVVPQTLTVINDAVAGGELASNPVVHAALTAGERVHLLGLVSDGGVHSGFAHLRALIELAGRISVPDLVVHCFTDGRDTSPTAGEGYLHTLEDWFGDAGAGRVGTVVGRYWAMDRDRRWERVQAAYDLLVHGRGAHAASGGPQAAHAAYARGETDEFITATTVGSEGRIRPQDSVLCFNFRPDRMREIVRALAEPGFGEDAEDLPGWRGRGGGAAVRRLTTMTEYQHGWPYPAAFHSAGAIDTLGAVIARAGETQLHVAETEKYAHVTYFFNGGEEHALPGEQRSLVPSQRDVPTYDLKPQMSAREVAVAFEQAFAAEHPRFSVINFANADMVGHTGVIPATITAVETVDECLGRVVSAVQAAGGACVVTADHGNAEEMLGPDGRPSTAHSLNPVPLIVTASEVRLSHTGSLADVAPTVLALLDIRQPTAMTGHSLLELGPEPIDARMRTIDDLAVDIDLDGARVLVRADLNVPLDHGRVADDSRIRAALPTIEELRRRGAAIVLVSHLGRPRGVDPALSLRPVAERLAELTDAAVTLAPAVVGDDVRRMAGALEPGAILLLENVRFDAGETVDDPQLSGSLAELADAYVNDAFGAAHRAHASTEGIAHLLPSAAGRLMERELQALHSILLDPSRPLVAVLGGAKVADKIGVVRRFLKLADQVLMGGAMAFPFLAAQGHSIGASRCAPADAEIATELLAGAPPGRLQLPVDLVIAEAASADAPHRTLDGLEVPSGWLGLDIGPRTARHYAEVIQRSGTAFWNGPMGVFELEPFASGTRAVAEALAEGHATTVAGGGETVAALRHLGLADQIDHVSTGGGATLELIEGRTLPGVQALMTIDDIPALAGAPGSPMPA
jgi:2,3-bisphosphoglycerate-independent phosphoglycerate mutase